jgi:hypothetical protein
MKLAITFLVVAFLVGAMAMGAARLAAREDALVEREQEREL